VQGVRFELPFSGMYRHSGGFPQTLSPFFSLLGSFSCRVKKSLAGDEIDEWENSQLPALRQDVARRVLERDEFFDSENGQMPSLRQPKIVERWVQAHAVRRYSALLVSRLRPSFFASVEVIRTFLFFFFVKVQKILEEAFF
jgi:hypothetical protein